MQVRGRFLQGDAKGCSRSDLVGAHDLPTAGRMRSERVPEAELS